MGLPAYPPPTNSVAYDAVTEQILETVNGASNPDAELALYHAPSFPIDIKILRCAGRDQKTIPGKDGLTIQRNGYDCAFEVFPNTNAPYKTAGFFYHDGSRWRYHGAIAEVALPPLSFYKERGRRGETTLKPGSLFYNGSPDRPLNEGAKNPYEDILGGPVKVSPFSAENTRASEYRDDWR